MKRWLVWAGALVSLLCLAYFARALAGHWQALGTLRWSAGVGAAVALALALYLGTYAVATRAWQQGLRLFGATPRYRALGRILLLSQFAKYLPGNLGHHVGRVVLARHAGLPGEVVVASMVLDTGLVLLAGAACSLPALRLLATRVAPRLEGAVPWLPWLLLVGVAALGALLASRRLRQAWRTRLPRLAGFRAAPRRLAAIWLWHCLSFGAGAAALYALCVALAPATGPATGALAVLGVYAAAWLLGFLMPGSPAGLGVREFVLLLGLGPLFGVQAATAAAALLRLVTTAGDGLAFLAASRLRAPA